MEAAEVEEILRDYGASEPSAKAVTNDLRADQTKWVDFMMRFELGLEAPDPKRARASAFNIGGSYIVGGLIPLLPYMVMDSNREALVISVAITLIALFVFGFIKGHFTGTRKLKSGLQTTLIGGVAAAAAFLIATWIGH